MADSNQLLDWWHQGHRWFWHMRTHEYFTFDSSWEEENFFPLRDAITPMRLSTLVTPEELISKHRIGWSKYHPDWIRKEGPYGRT